MGNEEYTPMEISDNCPECGSPYGVAGGRDGDYLYLYCRKDGTVWKKDMEKKHNDTD